MHDGTVLLASLLTLLGVPAVLSATTPGGDASGLTSMTFNIRYDGNEPPGHAWHERLPRVVSILRAHDVDVVGVQEALDRQVTALRRELDDYAFYGVGRKDGESEGEYAGIFWRDDRFEDVERGNFWLSLTPDEPGSTFPGTDFARIATWVILADEASGRELLVVNTHWSHVSREQREHAGRLIHERLPGIAAGRPIILLGDLNTTESTLAFAALAGGPDDPPVLIDAYREVHPRQRADEATFHGFNGDTAGERIDFVLVSRGLSVTSAEIVRTQFDGKWPADHYPVLARVAIPAARE